MNSPAVVAIKTDLRWFLQTWARTSSTPFINSEVFAQIVQSTLQNTSLSLAKQALKQSSVCQDFVDALSNNTHVSVRERSHTKLIIELSVTSLLSLCFQTIQASRFTCFHSLAQNEQEVICETLSTTESFTQRIEEYRQLSDTLAEIAAILDDLRRINNRMDSVTVPLRESKGWEDTLRSVFNRQDPRDTAQIIAEFARCVMGRWTKRDLFCYSGTEFENVIVSLFNALGVNAKATRESKDYGIDFIIEESSYRAIGQVKRHSNPLGLKEIRGYLSLPTVFDADKLIIVSTSELTDQARKYYCNSSIQTRVITGEHLVLLFNQSPLHPPCKDSIY